METTGSLQSQYTTAFVELSSAVHNKVSEVSVSDGPTDRGGLRCLNPPNDLSLETTLSATKRLFIDSGLASSRPGANGQGVAVVTGGASVPTRQDRASSVSRRWEMFSQPVWTAPTAFLAGGTSRPVCLHRTNRGLPHRSCLAASRDLHGFSGKGDAMIHRPCLVAGPAGSDRRTRRPSRALHLDGRSWMT